MKYLKSFENHDYSMLKDSLRKLSDSLESLSKIVKQRSESEERKNILGIDHYPDRYNLEGLSDLYKDFFSYFTDDDWSININPLQFYLTIELRKSFKDDVNGEEIFNIVNKYASSIKGGLKSEGFNTHYTIKFNSVFQSEHNPKTNKNDLYLYKGFNKFESPAFTGDTSVGKLSVIVKFFII